MKLYVLLNEAGYIDSSSSARNISTRKDTVDCIEIDVPEDFDVLKQREYRIVGGKLVHDPLPEPEPQPDPQEVRLMELQAALEEARLEAAENRAAIIELAEIIVGGV